MDTLTATFLLDPKISTGLVTGLYERVGGVIREVGSKQVVAWLREVGEKNLMSSGLPLPIDPVTGVLNMGMSLANTAVSMKGFSDVNLRLDGIGQQLGAIGQGLQQVQGTLQIVSAASILNLGVSAIGFAVINQRLNELEHRLQKAQELLTKINRKIDLGFYARFRAASDLAINAFTMNKPENRRSSALSAISLFLEAEHVYTDYVDQELEQKSQIADEYLLTLALAYIAEARCYLELEEWDTALRRFEEGSAKLRSRVRQYVELLLTSNPAAYLHPQQKEQIDLPRLTRVYQWLDPTLNEVTVFELLREKLYSFKDEKAKWIDSMPSAIVASAEVQGSIFGNKEEMYQEALKRLPAVMESMESMIETNYRFESYQSEVKAIAQYGISFHEWMNLKPSEQAPPDGNNLMFIFPSSLATSTASREDQIS